MSYDEFSAGREDTDGNPVLRTGVTLTCASEVSMARVRWLWQLRMAVSAISLVVGMGGRGKSSILYDVGARLTRGQLEGDFYGTPSNIVVATAEDALAQVAVPRLVAAGADLARVSFVEYQTEGIAGIVNLPQDIDALTEACMEVDAALLVLDPIVAFLDGKIDAHRDQDVRRVLVGLVRLAEKCNLAVAGVIHLNKATSTDVISRVSGSIGFVNAARSVLFAGPDPQDETRSVLIPAKNNLAALGDGVAYRIESRTVTAGDEEIQTQGVAWLGDVPGLTASDMLNTGDEDRSAFDEAIEFLTDALGGSQPVEAKTIIRDAKAFGISEKTLRRAKKALSITSKKLGAPDAEGQRWCWVLPHEHGQPRPEGGPSQNMATLATFDENRHSPAPIAPGNGDDPRRWPDLDPGHLPDTAGHLQVGICVECGSRPATRTSAANRPWCDPCWDEALATNMAQRNGVHA